jgi:NTP pyrophosphatase (non-canonical NTP hydrolase)
VYSALGLAGEAGELCNKLKKHLRGDGPLDRAALVDELGDVLWYVAAFATDLGVPLAGVASQNIVKLAARKAASTLRGAGDAR